MRVHSPRPERQADYSKFPRDFASARLCVIGGAFDQNKIAVQAVTVREEKRRHARLSVFRTWGVSKSLALDTPESGPVITAEPFRLDIAAQVPLWNPPCAEDLFDVPVEDPTFDVPVADPTVDSTPQDTCLTLRHKADSARADWTVFRARGDRRSPTGKPSY